MNRKKQTKQKANMNQVAVQQDNFFESYGEQASQKTIVGKLLKFSKGDYTAGEKDEDVPVGTQLIANMDELLVGWIRWSGGKPTDQIMGAVTKGYQAPKRNTLGDADESGWDLDDNGKPKDPWSFTNYLVLKVPNSDEMFTFSTSSRGGLSAMGELCKAYGKSMRAKPNDWPIVQLKVDSYIHASFGKIKVPVLDIVAWAPKAEFGEEAATSDEVKAIDSPSIVPADSSGRSPRGSGDYAKTTF